MPRHPVCRLSLAALLAFAATAGAQTVALNNAVTAQINRAYPALEALYQDIHTHPEIAFEETRKWFARTCVQESAAACACMI